MAYSVCSHVCIFRLMDFLICGISNLHVWRSRVFIPAGYFCVDWDLISPRYCYCLLVKGNIVGLRCGCMCVCMYRRGGGCTSLDARRVFRRRIFPAASSFPRGGQLRWNTIAFHLKISDMAAHAMQRIFPRALLRSSGEV